MPAYLNSRPPDEAVLYQLIAGRTSTYARLNEQLEEIIWKTDEQMLDDTSSTEHYSGEIKQESHEGIVFVPVLASPQENQHTVYS